MTKSELAEFRRGIEWKANLYALVAELLRDAEAGDPTARRIITRVGITEPLRLATTEKS